MRKLDRFILASFIGPFIAILLVVLFILMMQFLWLYIDELVGKGLGLKVILEFLMWGICTILPLALPLATLLASMMTLGAMGENNELLAMKSAGIPLTRIMMPLLFAAVVISIGAYFAGNNLVPKAYNEIYTLRDDIGKTKNEIKIPTQTFYEGIEGYVMRVETQDDNSGILHQVMVYDHSSQEGNTSVTLADSALITLSKGKDYLIFTLFDGSTYREENKITYRDTSLSLHRIDFDKQELVIPLANYSFEKSDSTRFSDQVKSMRLSQLVHDHDSLGAITAEKQIEIYDKFRLNLPFDYRGQLDTAIRNAAMPVFDVAELNTFDDEAKHLEALKQSEERLDQMLYQIKDCSMEIYDENFFLRHTDVELLKKFAQAIACLLMFLIGAPLGALIGKGGLGASAIVSILFFVLYWVIDISGTKLANDGAIAASIGVFISAYVLLPIGLYLTWKATHDSRIQIGKEEFKRWKNMLFSKIGRFFRPARIVYMGTPDFAVAPLDALRKAGYKVVGVVTVADKPVGRGLKVSESPVKKYALQNGLPLLQPLSLKDPDFLSQLSAWKADLFVVVAFRMLPEEVWSMPKLGTVNLHAALLPQYRGAAPINWAIINGERRSGVTTFLIDKNMDTGNILLRQECPIGPRDDAGDLHDRLMEIGSRLMVETVSGLVTRALEPRLQREFVQGDEVLLPAPKITPELCRIDWNSSATKISNLVRGLSPSPAAFTDLVCEGQQEASRLKIYRAFPATGVDALPPGALRVENGRLFAGCGEGVLEILELQMAGKKRMEAKAFLAGFRNPETYRLV